MSYRSEKTSNGSDLIIEGFENGVENSPHDGLANLQNVNISTESGEVMCSFGRVQQSQEMATVTGTLVQVNTNTVTATMGDGSALKVGQVITVTNAGTTGLTTPFTALTSVSALIVAGGGGGGNGQSGGSGAGGGGGGGGLLSNGAIAVSAGTMSVTVGTGGATNTSGTNSVFASNTAVGGGHGGTYLSAGTNGGSGGGSGGASGSSLAGGSGTSLQGNAGGGNANVSQSGGGGGGANATGTNATNPNPGNGGNGIANSISGASVTYSGGGGGGAQAGTAPAGGTGGTGGGGTGGSTTGAATAATANTGSGGGGGGPGSFVSISGGAGADGIVIISYPGTPKATGGTITQVGGNTIHTFTSSGSFVVLPTQSGNYYYLSTGKLYGGTTSTGSLPPNNPDTTTPVTGITSGTATFTLTYPMGQPFQSATEPYRDSTGAMQYRYYILDTLGSIWVHDTHQFSNVTTPLWFFAGNAGTGASGLAVLNGWLLVCPAGPTDTLWKLTVLLGNVFSNTGGILGIGGSGLKYSTVAQSTIYIASGNTITTIQPDVGLIASFGDIQSYGSFTVPTGTTVGIISLISGANPTVGIFADRIPAIFFTDGTLPTAINASTIYYIQFTPSNPGSFQVFGASSGGSALDIKIGSTGDQYYNTFDPTSGAGQTTLIYTFNALILPYYETTTAIAQLGINLVVGTTSNIVYLWDKTNLAPSGTIFLAENNVAKLLTVNNNVFIFTGNKGNVYITNGSAATPALSIPDYCAGLPGTPSSYIEPYFAWGDAMYLRGRIYCSIQDQTSIKSGNCGGVWSFIPFQQITALRLENQNSYGTYNGASSVLLPSQQQNAISPQYWSGWYSSITSPSYGIDFTDTVPVTTATFETDLIPTGTVLDKKTFTQIEYKLSAPLASGESVSLSYRQNATDSYQTCGPVQTESATDIAGYFQVNFQKGQWIQFLATLTSTHNSSSSFVRLIQIRIR